MKRPTINLLISKYTVENSKKLLSYNTTCDHVKEFMQDLIRKTEVLIKHYKHYSKEELYNLYVFINDTVEQYDYLAYKEYIDNLQELQGSINGVLDIKYDAYIDDQKYQFFCQ